MGTIATLKFARRAISMTTPKKIVIAVVSRQDGKILACWVEQNNQTHEAIDTAVSS